MNNFMSMEMYQQSLIQMMQKECEKVKTAGMIQQDISRVGVTADNALNSYLSSAIPNYTSNVSAVQSTNIRFNFPNGGNLGNLIGFVDTGLLLMAKKGKVGVAFYTEGIAQRSVMEKTDTAISYATLCQSVIQSKKNLLMVENRFAYHQEKFIVIEAADKMKSKLQLVRAWLLKNDNTARTVYDSCYCNFVDKVQALCQANKFSEALAWIEALFEFAESNRENGYYAPKSLLILLYLMQNDFRSAMETADKAQETEWKKIISEQKDVYHQILNHQYYEKASAAYQDGKIPEALQAVRMSLENWSTVDSWQLYANLILENANEENLFLRSEMEYLTSSEPTSEQKQVLEQEKERIDALNKTYQAYLEKVKSDIVEKIKENDVEFFKNYQDIVTSFTDEYGMNALMYAALYHQREIMQFLIQTNMNQSQTNVLGLNHLDLCVLGTVRGGMAQYQSIAGNADMWYVNEYQKYQNYQKSMNSQENAQNIEQNYQKCANAHWLAHLRNAWGTVNSFYMDEIQELPEESAIPEKQCLPEDAALEAYSQNCQNLFRERETAYIAEYLQTNLPVLEPKREFESTLQYQEREKQYQTQKTNLEQKAKELFKESGLRLVREQHLKDVQQENEQYRQNYQKQLANAKIHNAGVALAKMIVNYFYLLGGKLAVLGAYDADLQQFAITYTGFWNNCEINVTVPVEIAPDFKSAFAASGIPVVTDSADITTGNVQCHITFEEKNYPFVVVQTPPEDLLSMKKTVSNNQKADTVASVQVDISPLQQYYSALEEMMLEECRKATSVNADHRLNISNASEYTGVTVDSEFGRYLSSLIEDYRFSLAGTQLEGIHENFSYAQKQLGGNLIGFIDTGLLMAENKGKYGIAFYTNGIAQRTFPEKISKVLNYATICGGVIQESNDKLISVIFKENENFWVVKIPSYMFNTVKILRTTLLAQNKEARATYKSIYNVKLGRIKEQYRNKNYEKAIELTKELFQLIDGNTENGYCEPVPVLIMSYLAKNDFDSAMKLASSKYVFPGNARYHWEPDEWKKIISEKRNMYHQILERQYYHQAMQYFQNGQNTEALQSVRTALENWSTVESWQLYAKLVLENAKESNFFLHSDLEKLTAVTSVPEQKQVQEQEKEKIQTVWASYQAYSKQLKLQMVEKIKDGNLDFIRNALDIVIDFTDDYGMNALMYAALYHQKEIFDFLCSTSISHSQKNVLSMDLLDLSILSSKNTGWQTYLDFVGNLDSWYPNRYQEYQDKLVQTKKEIQDCERAEKVANFAGNFANSVERQAIRKGTATTEGLEATARLSSNAATASSNAATEKSRLQYVLDHAEEEYQKDIQNHWKTELDAAWRKIKKFAYAEIKQVPDEKRRPEEPDFSDEQLISEQAELESYPSKYRMIFHNEESKFLEKYLLENCPELEPQGEFETTPQYQSRKEAYYEMKENMQKDAKTQFVEEGMRIVRKQYIRDIEQEHQAKWSEYQKKVQQYSQQIKDIEIHNKSVAFAQEIAEFFYTYGEKIAILDKYNPDEQYFLITWDGFWKEKISTHLNIPIEIAQQFKEAVSQSGIAFTVDCANTKTCEIMCHTEFQGANYSFILKQKSLDF